jgi:transcription elongation factor Elf1
MEKSFRTLLIQKNYSNNKHVSSFSQIFTCNKCRKYNSVIINDNDTTKNKFQNCQFCSTPNYVNKTIK